MNAAIIRIAETLAASDYGQWAAASPLAYPLANVLHLLGLVMLVGGIGLLDLRLVGLFRALPVAPLSKALTPIAIAGIFLMVPSGLTMVAADAAVAESATFRWKLLLIGIALANAVAFRWLWRDPIDDWDRAVPASARLMAAGSILLWLTVATFGRMIAYS